MSQDFLLTVMVACIDAEIDAYNEKVPYTVVCLHNNRFVKPEAIDSYHM